MKAKATKIKDGVYFVGVLDWDLRDYHGYTLDGTTYGCYLVFGEEKVALIDNVYPGHSAQLWGRIEDAFEKENREFKIDVIIQNHIEKDHLGSLPEVIKKFPDVEVYCTKVAINGIKNHLPVLADFEFNAVDTGDSVELGGKTLAFVKAAMLHWPDSMFTMCLEDGILFSNDGFGQHLCLSERFDDEIPEETFKRAAQKFYANLITPSSIILQRKIEELKELELLDKVEIIAPCHGQIIRNPEKIIKWYTEWSTGVCKDKVTLVYDTMHHSTQTMAHAIAEGIMSEGCEVKMYYLHEDERSEIVTDVLDSKAICIGAPTIMNSPFPSLGDIVFYLDALRFNTTSLKRKALLFGSKGWGGGATRKLTPLLESAGFDVVDSYDITYVPTKGVLDECFELGKNLAQQIKEM